MVHMCDVIHQSNLAFRVGVDFIPAECTFCYFHHVLIISGLIYARCTVNIANNASPN